MANQTATVTSALFVDNGGALEVAWLDVASGSGWAGPQAITAAGVAPRGARLAMGKHPAKSCGGHGQQCCSQTGCDVAYDVCDGPGGFSNLTDPRNTCQCGNHGDPCCGGTSCGAGLVCLPDQNKIPTCQCGEKGQPCCINPDPAKNEYVCGGATECAAGICSCGAPGQVCCGGTTCNDGKACTKDAHGVGRCPVPEPCGGNGQKCCATGNSCSTGLACTSGRCAPKATTCSGAAQTSTAQWFRIGLKRPTGCSAGVVPFFANTLDEAALCATKANPGTIAVTTGSDPQYYAYGEVGPLGICTDIQVPAFSDSDAQSCAKSLCINCTFIGGGCPPEGHAPVCAPIGCDGNGANCGTVSDGCGGVLDCGTCSGGTTCGGGGAPGVCGCIAVTCDMMGATCGTISDGCGGTLTCGTCATGTVCGGGGTPNVCACRPRHCPRLACGTIDDGCGGELCCGGAGCCS
jgi:hypothetical protein